MFLNNAIKYGFFLVFLMTFGALVSCAKTPVPYTMPVKQHDALVQSIRKHHIRVIEIGEKVLIIMPLDHAFIPQSKELWRSYRLRFSLISELIQSYPNARVEVNGYSDEMNLAPAERKKDSLEYAQVVASYLWNAGIPLDHMTVQGFGSVHKVSNERTHADGNRRVEIWIDLPK